jgi:hypothetical protein
MPRFLAKSISVLLHPVIMPLIGMVIIFHSGTTLSIMDKNIIRLIYLFVALVTLVMPISFIPLFIRYRFIRSIEMNNPGERVIPYFITFLLYYTAHILIGRFGLNYYFSAYLFSAAILVLVLLIISYFWKISSHMAGIGGLCGLVFSLSFEFKADLMMYLIILLFIAGLLGSARLKLESHTQGQVYSGFITGLIVIFSMIHLLFAYRI